ATPARAASPRRAGRRAGRRGRRRAIGAACWTPFRRVADGRLLSAVATRKRAGICALALRLDRVLRVARRLESRLEHRPAQAQLAGADHGPTESRRPAALRSPPGADECAGACEALRRPRELARRASVADPA